MMRWNIRTDSLAGMLGVFVAWGSLWSASSAQAAVEVSGESLVWHPLTITFDGPSADEAAAENPFSDYRLVVTFSQGELRRDVPGYFAADGRSGESSATAGNRWRVHFVPDRPGEWRYDVHLRHGKDVAVSDDPAAGTSAAPDGTTGTLSIRPPDPNDASRWRNGKLQAVGGHYLRYAGSGQYYIKGGADSPENLLGYADFDGTFIRPHAAAKKGVARALHTYAPHVQDHTPGDPTWRGGKGKGLIGGLNYLASKGVNSIYFLTMNVTGDGDDVWPWVAPDIRDRFDCSKLDQWNLAFDHMDRLGISLHVVTQEQENDQLLDGGDLGRFRRLYYRELIARFAYHQGVVWNLGEENTNTTAQRKQFADYFRAIDPYRNPIVVHTFPEKRQAVYEPLLGAATLDGLSMQFKGDYENMADEVRSWCKRSDATGHPWVVNIDEMGPANRGVDPDSRQPDNNQARARKYVLWAPLMSGAGGVEWYFGYQNPHNDLTCEDWRSRDHVWDATRVALDFFQRFLPFHDMQPSPERVAGSAEALCLADSGKTFGVYLPNGGEGALDVGPREGVYEIGWYDPRQGGDLTHLKLVRGSGRLSLGVPPERPSEDWAVRIRRVDEPQGPVEPARKAPPAPTTRPQNQSR